MILHVVGARPNFMKVAPVMRSLSRRTRIQQVLVHTGQHFDGNMSDVFFRQLDLPEPDVNLDVGPGTHAQQTAEIMKRLEPVVTCRKPSIVLVYGDVNSTVAGALVCAKLGIPVAHVEAGLRSFDRTMPEEINRLLTDQLADLLFTPSVDADENLLKEGIVAQRIHRVGNVMIDSLVRALELMTHPVQSLPPFGSGYVLVTLHRPSNVDDLSVLRALLAVLSDISLELPVIFPVHPRTRQRIAQLPGITFPSTLQVIEPLGYLEFLALERNARLVITDSGGVQEETTYLGVPCLTVRENTERPLTVTVGTNILVGRDTKRLRSEVAQILAGNVKQGRIPDLWDGKAAERIAEIIEDEVA